MNNEYNLQTAKEHIEAQMRVMQEDLQRISAEYEEQTFRWKRERNELIARLGDMH